MQNAEPTEGRQAKTQEYNAEPMKKPNQRASRIHSAFFILHFSFFLLPSCRTPLPGAAERTREISSVEESRVLAVQDGDRLALRFRLKGRDAYATVALPDKSADSQAVMKFDAGAKDAFAAAKKNGRALRVLGAPVWRTLSRKMAAELAPESRRQGVLVTTGGHELIVCRDATGAPVFLPLTARPRGMKIIRRVTATQLVPRLTSAFTQSHGTSGPALVLTGQSPAMLLVDPGTARLTFISTPPEGMMKLPILGASPDVTVRGLLSLGLRSGTLATLKNPVTTLLNAGANVISMADSALHGLLRRLPAAPPPSLSKNPPMDLNAWEQQLDKITGEPRVPATVRLRIDGEQFFPDFIEAIQEARESIDIMLYIFDSDDYAIQIADLLKAKSKEVRVRIMIDDAASLQSSLLAPEFPTTPGHRAPSSIVEYLRRDSRIHIRPMAMPALSATHSKMILIDGRRAWLGGMNIGREYRSDWHDMMIEVTGPLLGWMQRSFARSWAHNGWTGDFAELITRLRSSEKAAARIPVPENAIFVRPLRGSALHSDIKTSQFAALRAAQQSIWLENAYISDSRFIVELIRARYRGVEVRVIVPAQNDNPIMKASNKALVPQLLRHGVRVWELPEMSHAKAALYDGWACVGSANYDRLSLRVNEEFNIGYSDPATVAVLRRDLFLKDMARGRELKAAPPDTFASQITDGLFQLLAGQF